jgi:nucleoid-associated protein YgaU
MSLRGHKMRDGLEKRTNSGVKKLGLTALAAIVFMGSCMKFDDRKPFDGFWDAFYAAITSDQKYTEVTAVKGDTLWGIAESASVPAARRDVYERQFREANDIPEGTQIVLTPGQAYMCPDPHDVLE